MEEVGQDDSAARLVLAIASVAARSVALAGVALDSLIEIGASAVVIWGCRTPVALGVKGRFA